jgi:hypothetical protein
MVCPGIETRTACAQSDINVTYRVICMRRMSLFLWNNQISSSWFLFELFHCRAFVSRIRYYSQAALRQPVGNTQYPEQNGRNWQLRWKSCPSVVVPLFLCENDWCNSLACRLNYLVSFLLNNSGWGVRPVFMDITAWLAMPLSSQILTTVFIFFR